MINGDDEATITKVAIIVEKNQAEGGSKRGMSTKPTIRDSRAH